MVPALLAQRLVAGIPGVLSPYPVELAYLFGSHARETADDESDVDIAVLANPALSQDERRDLRFDLLPACSQGLSLPITTIDLIVLQDVPALLQYNVIRHGQVLF